MGGTSCDVRGVMYFDVAEDIMVKRCLNRYNAAKDAGEIVREDDADPKVIKKRLATNRSECEPIVEMYKAKGMVYELDGGLEMEDVWKSVQKSVRDVEKKMGKARRELETQMGIERVPKGKGKQEAKEKKEEEKKE